MIITRLKYWIPAIFLSALIFFLSSLETNEIPEYGFEFGDKLLHLLAFFVYGISLYIGFHKSFINKLKSYIVILTVISGLIFAASDEYHQSFVFGRVCDFYDFLADSIGIILSAFVSSKYIKLLFK